MKSQSPRAFFPAIVLAGFFLLAGSINVESQAGHRSSTRRAPSRVETIQFHSAMVGKTLPYNVILPSDYRSSARRYPVLYLLHGWAGHYGDWGTRTNVADYAAQYRMIVVMPEGNDGWYADSATVVSD